jgi:hypothetical protein
VITGRSSFGWTQQTPTPALSTPFFDCVFPVFNNRALSYGLVFSSTRLGRLLIPSAFNTMFLPAEWPVKPADIWGSGLGRQQK